MNLDVDFLINFFDKFSGKPTKGEMDEQDAGAAPASSAPSSSGGSGKAVPKWEELYTIKVGKANPRMKAGTKWETGLTRGVGNQIW